MGSLLLTTSSTELLCRQERLVLSCQVTKGESSVVRSPLAATTVELARPCPEEGTVRCLGVVLRLGVSTLASKVWYNHEAGCLSETQVVSKAWLLRRGRDSRSH